MIKYIIYFIIILFISLYLFIRFKFRFWFKQPVFHIYNLRYWIFPIGQIKNKLDDKDSIDYDNLVHTEKISTISTEKKELFTSLIKFHYLDNKKEYYNPPKHAILDYLNYHNNSTFISLYYKYDTIKRINEKDIKTSKIIAGMSSRPLTCKIKNNSIVVGYVDFLCVHKNHRKKGLAQKIIYTHAVDASKDMKNPIFLFKREGELNFIVPLIAYNSYTFSTKKMTIPNINIENKFVTMILNGSNLELFFHYFKEIENEFLCVISPCFENIKKQIENNLLFIILILNNNEPIGCYIFRNPFTFYNNKNSIECIASYYTQGYKDVFIRSFQNAIILIKQKNPFHYLIIENISKNNIIIKNIIKSNITLWKCPMAYYFYNYVRRPFLPKDVFLLN
jgi:hypothetical protein